MLENVRVAIEAAEKILPGEVAPDGEEDPRWQAIMLIEDIVETELEAILPFVLKWGRHQQGDCEQPSLFCWSKTYWNFISIWFSLESKRLRRKTLSSQIHSSEHGSWDKRRNRTNRSNLKLYALA